ncbi:MAG: hypothetical protein RIS70_422 [Planctomycetota bacterium]
MTVPQSELISRYLDDSLSPEEYRSLQQLLRSSPQCVKEFVGMALMHDRLRGELAAASVDVECLAEGDAIDETAAKAEITPVIAPLDPVSSGASWRFKKVLAFLSAVAATLLIAAAAWFGVGRVSLAAAAELDRLIAMQQAGVDRTYQISVEETAVRRSKREVREEEGRPPKPPIDGAVLHVRKGNQFVLIRLTREGQPFVTGSDGTTSWSVRPDGPVRVSRDRTRFNRDLPGHEHGVPLFDIEQGLEQVRSAYDIQLLPIATSDDPASSDLLTRVLVAVKKRGHRGPQRVEITYEVETGLIRQMRFVEMPYGPERLTVRLTLEEEVHLGTEFFRHASHHGPERIVEEE